MQATFSLPTQKELECSVISLIDQLKDIAKKANASGKDVLDILPEFLAIFNEAIDLIYQMPDQHLRMVFHDGLKSLFDIFNGKCIRKEDLN